MEDVLKAVEPIARERSFSKRSVIIYQGEIPLTAYIVRSGIIKAYNINSAGNEQIADFYKAGEMFPSTWIFGKSTNAIYYYEALTDAKTWMVEKDALLEKIYSDLKLMRVAFEQVASHYTSSLLRVTALEQSRAAEKVMFTLYYLAQRYSSDKGNGRHVLDIKLTQNVLADMMGLTRETTTNELIKLKKQKVIDYSPGQFVIHKDKLERLMGEDSFGSLVA